MNKHEHATIARSPGDSAVIKWTVFQFLSAKMEYREIDKKFIACVSSLSFRVEKPLLIC